MRVLNIGIIGLGCVGMGVVEILKKNRALIAKRCGHELVITRGVVQDLSKKRAVDFPLSDRLEDILDDPSIDVVVELMGGVEQAFQVAQRALKQKKGFVTANKAMLAQHYYSLQNLGAMGFEASVCGGLPIINALQRGLSANEIRGIQGILNGTTNFILSQMEQGQDFASALQQAQALGYAEANAHLDISGLDSAHKLLILSFLAFHIQPSLDAVFIEGIERIKPIDMHYAKRLERTIKHLALAHKQGDKIALSVCPVLLDQNHLLARVEGVMNGVCVLGDCLGESFYYGAGAGGLATASAVVSDLMGIANKPFYPIAPTPHTCQTPQEIQSAYYLRMELSPHSDPLCLISPVLEKCHIKICAYFQEDKTCIVITEITTQAHIQQALLLCQQIPELQDIYAMRLYP
ncbi:Homoserine dehydrogenase Hom [Helicobacter bizzozeronii]|nr:Homoserine dehydrogenase Hom [Helicobacter bizzozeronii]